MPDSGDPSRAPAPPATAGFGARGTAIARAALGLLYRVTSARGRSLMRPLLWLVFVNAGAWWIYARAARPAGSMVGRAASGVWGWTKSWFVQSAAAPPTPSGSLSGEQERALFEFWWSSAVPLGTVPRGAYEKSVLLLYGQAGAPWFVHLTQAAHLALNLILVFLLALAVRYHVTAAEPGTARR